MGSGIGCSLYGWDIDSSSDLDWEELGDFGADIEAGRYLGNHDVASDYEDMNNQTDIVRYKVPPKDNIARKTRKRSASL